MRKLGFMWLLLGAAVVAALLRMAGSPPTEHGDDAAVATGAATESPSEAPSETATDAPAPPMQDYAAHCFRELRARNPVGRMLKLNANRLANRCSIIVETAPGSGRWIFDWRDGDNGWRHEGELRWPRAWPATITTRGIDATELAGERLMTMMQSARDHWPESDRDDWLYEIVWVPAPFERALVYITFDDRRPQAGPHDALSVVYDGERQLEGEEYAQADALYPLTRFELREDHNFKGALYESTALAESAVSLEGDAGVDHTDPLHAGIERCMHWLHEVNAGARVLRVALDADTCWLLQENAHARDDFYLFSARGTESFEESPSLSLEPPPAANLLLDRSRLSAARLRERLEQARGTPAGLRVERIAIAWVDGAMLWQFDGRAGGRRTQVWLGDDGSIASPPLRFPLSAEELDRGFPATSPVLSVAAESVLP
ncbi:MAG: hypothetical protein IT479_06770 [Xanthomonadales bacterium]|nr:hypothetical protein [Xanthomonadales bacterium]MCC6592963.1 hypothetical protein [Xanthomonadales bacterium]MCE7930604.1 hypothetical protein [Xanthomonadales bacterium PRO6]